MLADGTALRRESALEEGPQKGIEGVHSFKAQVGRDC